MKPLHTNSVEMQKLYDRVHTEYKKRLGEELYRQVIDGSGLFHSSRVKDIVHRRLEKAARAQLVSTGAVDECFHLETDMMIESAVNFSLGVAYMINGESDMNLPAEWRK